MSDIQTPLDSLIVELATHSFNNPSKPDLFLALVQQQLVLLRVLYLEMHDIDFYEKTMSLSKKGRKSIPIEEFALNSNLDTNKAILRYQLFLFVVNQFGRALGEKHKVNLSEFPSYYEIRFYRNKVSEHWDEYVDAINNRGLTFKKGAPAIPFVGEVFQPDKRKKIANKLERVFLEIGIKISVPDEFSGSSMISNDPKYTQFIFENLRKIHRNLGFPPKKDKKNPEYQLITLLFDFGFPSPILDLKKYVEKLVAYIGVLVQKNLIRSKS